MSEPDDAGNPSVLRMAEFVGREPELAALGRALAAPPAVVLIEGEAGIGKTRLVREFLASPTGRTHTCLVASCPPFRQPHTLGPLADALRQCTSGVRDLQLSALGGALRPLFPEWAADLAPAPEPAEDATAARHRLFRALGELLGCLGVDLLALEDTQWADDATFELLLFLASQQPQPQNLVLTCRAEEVPADSPLRSLSSRSVPGTTRQRIGIGPLTVAETATLMSSMLNGEPVSPEFAAYVHHQTEGVPLAVEESVRLMADRADIIRAEHGWVRRRLSEIAVPPTVRDAVLQRAQHLSADTRDALRGVAVLAEPAAEAHVVQVSGLPADRARLGLSGGLACGLLQEDRAGLVSFRHLLARLAVYEAMSGHERRALHVRAGQLLERLPPTPRLVAQLARHFREAGDAAKWCRYGEWSADLALASGDEATAVSLLFDLVTSAGQDADFVARLAGKFPLASFTGPARYRDLAAALRSFLDADGIEPDREAVIRYQLGQVLLCGQDWLAGRAELERAIPQLRAGSPEALRAMLLLGWPRGTACPGSEHLRWLKRAAAAPAPLAPADHLRFVVDHTTALLQLGEEEGWSRLDQIPDDARSAGERREITRAHQNFGDQAMTWGRYPEARRQLATAARLATGYGYARLHDEALVTQIHLDWFTGRWDGLARRAAELAGNRDVQPLSRLDAALITGLLHAAEAGPRAGGQLGLVLRETRSHGAVEFCMEPAAALARLALAGGHIEEALQVTEEPIGIVTGKGTWIWATDVAPARVEALAAAARTDEAAALTEAFARGLGGRDAPAPRATLIQCRGILAEARGDHLRAASLFASAAAALQALPRPYDALRTRERQGGCLIAAGRTEAGLRILTDAARGLRHLGARCDASRVSGRLQALGADPAAPRRGRPGYGDRLSPRELEVVRLLVKGRTNRQIASTLVVSVQTVASHLHSAMRKLKVSSRTALAVSVVELGLTQGDTRPRAGINDPA